MKDANVILKLIKRKTTYDLNRDFDFINSIVTGLIVGIILLSVELLQLIVPDIKGVQIATHFAVMVILSLITVFLLKSYAYRKMYLSLKERKIDRQDEGKARKQIEEEIGVIEGL